MAAWPLTKEQLCAHWSDRCSAGVKVVADASSRTDGQLRLPMFGEVRLKTHAVTEVHAVGDVDSSVAVDLRTLAEINMAADVRALHA